MRANRSHGREGTTVIAPGWGASHAAVMARSRTAEISLGTNTEPGWVPVNEVTTPGGFTVYASNVPASVVELPTRGGNTAIDVAEEQLATSDYAIGVDHGQAVNVGDVAKVTTADGSPQLVGRLLRVDRVGMGAEHFEVTLYCTLLSVGGTP